MTAFIPCGNRYSEPVGDYRCDGCDETEANCVCVPSCNHCYETLPLNSDDLCRQCAADEDYSLVQVTRVAPRDGYDAGVGM